MFSRWLWYMRWVQTTALCSTGSLFKKKKNLSIQVSENDSWACWVSYKLVIVEFAWFLWRRNKLLRNTWGKSKTSTFPKFLSCGDMQLMILTIKEGRWHGENWLNLKWESIFLCFVTGIIWIKKFHLCLYFSNEVHWSEKVTFLILNICDSLFPFRELEQYIC